MKKILSFLKKTFSEKPKTPYNHEEYIANAKKNSIHGQNVQEPSTESFVQFVKDVRTNAFFVLWVLIWASYFVYSSSQ